MNEPNRDRTGQYVAALLLIALAAVAFYQWRQPEQRPGRPEAHNKLKDLALSMHNYHAEHGCIPPSAVYAADGTPLLSWRVLVLPYLDGQDGLYEQFHVKQAWDGPDNYPLLGHMPAQFAPPKSTTTPQPYTTYYQVLVGKGTAFEGTKGLNFERDFEDGTSNTVLIVVAPEAVAWTAPVDVAYDPDKPIPPLGDPKQDYFLVALADGSVHTVNRRSVSEATLRAAICRNDGKPLGDDW